MDNVRVRIAPSPTGEDLHIGNVYTALINYIFARKNNGKFILRIEDTDRKRLIEGSEERIINSLKWFGIEPDESPFDQKGQYGPYRQSERLSLYREQAMKLLDENKAYYCFCTEEDLALEKQEQIKQKLPAMYSGKCKNLTKDRIASNLSSGKKHVIRLNVPDSGETSFNDLIRGKIIFENKLIDDQILIKSDGFPTYHLAVVVDDYLMKISHVIRAEEWISSTPKHILIYQAFGWELPVFVHGPILRNTDKSKLSKRKNPVWASWYRESGFLPQAVLNYLSLMGWSMPDEREIFSIEELIENFELKDLKTAGPAFDLKKLEWMNGEYIRKSQNSQIKNQILEFYDDKLPGKIVEKTIPLIKERIKKLSEYLPLCQFFFERPKNYEMDLKEKTHIIAKSSDVLKLINNWNAENIGMDLMGVCKKIGEKPSDFFMSLRVAITGKKISPPLNESMEILGKEEVLERLRYAIEKRII